MTKALQSFSVKYKRLSFKVDIETYTVKMSTYFEKQRRAKMRRKSPRDSARTRKRTNQTRARVEVFAAKRGWSLTEVASRMGISLQGLGSILERDSPTDTTLMKIAVAFECEVKEIAKPVTAAEYGEAMLPRA